MSESPEGWVETTLGEVCEVISGATPKTNMSEYWGGEIPWITPDDLSKNRSQFISVGKRSITTLGFDSCSTHMIPAGSVLYTSRAPIGYVAIAGQQLCTNQGFKSFVVPERIFNKFLYWYLIWHTPKIRALGSGTTFKEISGTVARTISFSFPSFAEQECIVSVIEEQFSKLDAAENYLNRANKNVYRMRRAILAETFYDGSELPKTWVETTLGEVCDVLDSRRIPVNAKSRLEQIGKVPYFGATGQVGWINRSLFNEELVLVGEDGAPFLDLYKKKAYIVNGPSWVNNHAHVIRARNMTSNRFLLHVLNTLDYTPFVNGTTRLKLTQVALKSIQIPLPPFAEQERIVSVIEEQFSKLDNIDLAIGNSLRRIEQLRRSILELAFTGKLVSQVFDNESASKITSRLKKKSKV